ncbi:MAG: DUF3883 domain-containing protein [Phycisphaerae bacterium]|nr:DUF3883 domain-containing protein [Phycisphaerae bacterium]
MTDQADDSFPLGQQIRLEGHFDHPVVLEAIRRIGAGYECRVRLPDGTLDETTISSDEARALQQVATAPSERITPAEPEKLRLLIESARIRLAYAHDSQFAVSLSGIRTLPHQIEAVYEHMLRQPRLRFLLADDPGAGKTIMAGLLIKELKLRSAIERILILCPAPLTIQWQDELLRWFQEEFEPIDAARDKGSLVDPWHKENQIIASIDYAKQDDVRERIWRQHWDLVLIDEAHKCSARTTSGGQGREPKVDATKRYELAYKLSVECDHALLLTATPHHGDEDKFAHFLRLLDPDLFPEPHRLPKDAAEVRKSIFRLGKDCPWALRRLKEDLKDIRGHRLFPDRHAHTVTFKLSGDEFALYKAVTEYINQFIPQQTGQRRTSAALARTVLQRRLASSTHAICESLRRRFEKQRDLLEELEALSPKQRAKRLAQRQGRLPDNEQDEDDLDDAARDQLADEYTAALEMEQLRAEIAALKELVEQSRRVRDSEHDSKLNALNDCLKKAQFDELKDGRGKLLLFTEHRDTLNHVRNRLQKLGYSTCEIHGGMNPHERKRAQETFRTTAQVCVATEAAGEGINLQFCHLMINYDLPWNPTRLEQRLGRIHRIGQDRDCHVFNFVATESEDGLPVIEGRILHRLLEKLDQMADALEGRVFDVIGEVLSLNDVNLPEMLRDVAYDPRRLDEYIDQIDRIDPKKLKTYEEATGIALARANVDFSAFQSRNAEVEEQRLMPRYVEAQFVAAAKEIGLRIEPRADGLWRVEHVLADLRSERLASVRKIGKPEPAYRKLTFHKHHLEQDQHVDAVLLGPGHALYAAVDERLNEKLADLQARAAFYLDPTTTAPYLLHFLELSIRGQNARGDAVLLRGELIAVREDPKAPLDERFEIIGPEILINLPPHPSPPATADVIDPQPAIDFAKSTYQLECRERCRQERLRFIDICRDYLEKSFQTRINRAQERAMRLGAQTAGSPEFQLAFDEARKLVDELGRQKVERLAGLDKLAIAKTGPVRHIATAIVLSAEGAVDEQLAAVIGEADPNERKRIELAAEDFVVQHLVQSEGFAECDCVRVGNVRFAGNKREGFDIRASRIIDHQTGEMEVRRIEVKGRQRGANIVMTTNEWYKAQQLADSFWLYVVWNPLGPDAELVRIQNPAAKLDHAKQEIVASRYFQIDASAIDLHR